MCLVFLAEVTLSNNIYLSEWKQVSVKETELCLAAAAGLDSTEVSVTMDLQQSP